MSKHSRDNKPNAKDTTSFTAIGLIISVFLVWALVVGLSGKGLNLFKVGWDFERTGQLGDSFGVVGALMASLAAYFTFQALVDEKAETAKLRNREMIRDQSDKRNQAEITLFRMFDMRIIILEGIHTKSGHDVFTGRALIEEIYKRFISSDLSIL
jgi:hypothetical protein